MLPLRIFTKLKSLGVGCTFDTCITLSQPTLLEASINSMNNISCNGGNDGSLLLTVTGGTPGYSFLWDASNQTTDIVSGLTAGLYCVTVTDVSGCTDVACLSLTEPSAVSATLTGTNVTCFGDSSGMVVANGSGGTMAVDYSFQWNIGNQTSVVISALTAGNYALTLTDDNGCSDTVSIQLSAPDSLPQLFVLTNDVGT